MLIQVFVVGKLIWAHRISKFAAKAQADSLVFAKTAKALSLEIDSLKQENFKLNEKNAMLINANLSLSARIRAINEYIKSGRLPANSTVH